MRVLVADDHSLFRDGITSLLEAAGLDIVGQAGNGQEAVEAVIRLKPDLVLLDIDMPKMNGLEALRLIKEKQPETKVVMLTVSEDDTNIFEAIQFGAQGYLLKNLNGEEFLALIEGLKWGEAAMTRRTTARLMMQVSKPSPQPSQPAQELTNREVEILGLVAGGLPNKAIAQKLSVSENTVKYHVRNILQKLGVQNRTEAVTQAIRAGILESDSFIN